MHGHTDRKRNSLSAALCLGQLDGPLDRRFLSGDDHLAWAVQVRYRYHANFRRLLANFPDRLSTQTENRRDQSGPRRDCLGHILRPFLDQRHRSAERHSARSHQRRILTETVAGHSKGPETKRFQKAESRNADCEQGGLRIFSQVQAFGRSIEAQCSDIISEDRPCLFVHLPDKRVSLIQCPPHPDRLRALAGKHQPYSGSHSAL